MYASRRNLLAAVIAGLAALVATPSIAQEVFPSKPIRIVVPYATGGSGDALARAVATKFGEVLGQPVIVENKPGAAATLGVADVAKLPADGYTIAFVAATFVITQYVYDKLPYVGSRDFVPVGLMQVAPVALVVHPSLDVKTPAEFIELAKRKPGEITYAHNGNGSLTHVIAEFFRLQTGVDITPIPYKGGGQSITDLIGGQVKSAFLSPTEVSQHIQSGRIVGIATTSARRPASMPNLPTFIEAGVKGFEVTSWFGLVVRTGTPEDRIAKLSSALEQALRDPEVRERLSKSGDVATGTREEFRDLLAREYPRWQKAVKDANIKAD